MEKLIEIFQGEDFVMNFSERNENSDLIDLDDYASVIIYAYTSNSKIKKYSRDHKPDYGSIGKVSDTEYCLRIDGKTTRNLDPGELMVEILVIDNTNDGARSIFAGKVCKIVSCIIKSEV